MLYRPRGPFQPLFDHTDSITLSPKPLIMQSPQDSQVPHNNHPNTRTLPMQEFCCSLISASLASPTGPPERRSSLRNGMPATAQKGRERKLWSPTFFLSPRRLLRTASPIWSWLGARPTDPQASTCAGVSSALQPGRHRGQGGQSASLAFPPSLFFFFLVPPSQLLLHLGPGRSRP